MDKAELLAQFQAQVEAFRKFQGFIDRAKEQASRFKPAIVEKVIKDNTDKQVALLSEIIPMMADLEKAIAGLRTEAAEIRASAAGSAERLEEIELRKEIGEIDDAEFASATAELRDVVDGAEGRAAALEVEVTSLQEAVDGWTALGVSAGMMPTEPSPTLAEEAGAAIAPPEEARPSARSAFEVGDLDIMGEDSEAGSSSSDPAVESAGASDRVRKAVLLYQEGTADEQVYPFNGDVLSLGRGRDNDIQVKNDSKVSRYHCKLSRRGGTFYVEDNKSANGTLVNGELITERRLFGGEEVIIGETFFRFRILD